jgi:fumarate reductase subunit D
MPARLAVATTASLIVLASAPAIGQIRGAIQAAAPDHYRLILISIVGSAVGAGVAWSLIAVRDRRLLRYGLIAAAVCVGAIYSLAMATGNANVDAVERLHFVEYGFLTLLFYRVWSSRRNLAALLLPFMAVFIVGTLDEAIQWFVPVRVGEWRDVLLNGVAIACGLLFGFGLSPPRRVSADLDTDSRRIVMRMTILTVAVFGLFFYTVHVGHEIRDPEIGVFRSRYTAGELLALQAARSQQWRRMPPAALRRYSREDQYLAEALWHLQRRNEADTEGGIWAQWKENLILEKYFAPVLELPTYATPEGARWPREQRDNASVAAAADRRLFVSDAHPFPIYAWFDR